MKIVKIGSPKNYKINQNKIKFFFKLIKEFNNNSLLLLVVFFVHIFVTAYLFLENKNQKKIIKEIVKFQNNFFYEDITIENKYPNDDKEMIGLFYPDIDFGEIKKKLKFSDMSDSLINLINQLEVKLIYLEKEINLTKLISFYTSRKFYLKENGIKYEEEDITQLHDIINWIIIHQSNQLKGIASDKYLACKYVKLKLGLDLCQQRIAVYNNIEDLNYKELVKYGNIVLKISNSCWKTVFINNNETLDSFNKKIEHFKKIYKFEHGIVNMQPFHLYPKKRIIVEKQFTPLTDLYEFKIYILNRNIKFIYLEFYVNPIKEEYMIYDENYNFIFRNHEVQVEPPNLKSMIRKDVLEKLKIYAINLSKDFPNFVRVDLYVFHDNIYFSELTFASSDGKPMDKNETYIKDAVKNFSIMDNYY